MKWVIGKEVSRRVKARMVSVRVSVLVTVVPVQRKVVILMRGSPGVLMKMR